MTNGEAAEPEGVSPEPRSLTEHAQILTLPPEAEAPLGCGHPAVPVGVAGVEEGPDANLVLVQVDGGQLSLVQVEVAVGVQLGEHPAYGVLAAGHQAPVQHCKHNTAGQNNWPRRPSRQLHKRKRKEKKSGGNVCSSFQRSDRRLLSNCVDAKHLLVCSGAKYRIRVCFSELIRRIQ